MKSFGNHMWYLTEELVPLALFSNTIDVDMKKKMVTKMLELEKEDGLCTKRYGYGVWKAYFPHDVLPTE